MSTWTEVTGSERKSQRLIVYSGSYAILCDRNREVCTSHVVTVREGEALTEIRNRAGLNDWIYEKAQGNAGKAS